VTPKVDCLIVGGGPAGLTAAIYAARFRLTVLLLDAGGGRAAMIPRTRNHAGFPAGISGRALILRMRRQAVRYGAAIEPGRVEHLAVSGDGFEARADQRRIWARTVLLATGVTNHRPKMSERLARAAVAAGRLRFCPVCDGTEVIDQAVAVIGTGKRGEHEALFLRTYTADLTLIAPEGRHDLTQSQRTRLALAGVELVDGPLTRFRLESMGLGFALAGERRVFEAVYPAMGTRVQSDLARSVGAKVTSDGCVGVDAHQRSSVPGFYAAGDVVMGLDQISHAMGEAGVAATAMRNDLCARDPSPWLARPVGARRHASPR